MALLPNSAKAILDVRKLQDYCLSPTHLRGRHKARTFQATLGIGQKDAVWLREALLEAASTESAIRLAADDYGERWRIDLRLTRQGRSTMIRTLWIVRIGEDAPRFVTCWVI